MDQTERIISGEFMKKLILLVSVLLIQNISAQAADQCCTTSTTPSTVTCSSFSATNCPTTTPSNCSVQVKACAPVLVPVSSLPVAMAAATLTQISVGSAGPTAANCATKFNPQYNNPEQIGGIWFCCNTIPSSCHSNGNDICCKRY